MQRSNDKMRRVYLGSDHAGFELKQELLASLKGARYRIEDVGAYNSRPTDYPDIAERLAVQVAENPGSCGILICGSGVGASVAANKIPGIRAGICHDAYSAHQGVEHDDMNVLVLGARVVGGNLAEELTRIYLGATFDHETRHLKRLKKIHELENKYFHFAFEERIA